MAGGMAGGLYPTDTPETAAFKVAHSGVTWRRDSEFRGQEILLEKYGAWPFHLVSRESRQWSGIAVLLSRKIV